MSVTNTSVTDPVTNVRVLFAPDPWKNPVVVATCADDDASMQVAFDRWAAEALDDPLWEHMHARLRDPEGYAAAEKAKHEEEQRRRSGSSSFSSFWVHKALKEDKGPDIGVYYDTMPLVTAPTPTSAS